MTEFETEGRGCPSAALGCQQLRQAMESGRILENRARAFDAQKQLRFRFADCEGVMPYEECADGIREGTVRPIAVLTRVGRQVCFVVTGFTEGPSGPVALLSRARAQRACREQYLSRLVPGDIIPCTVTHIEPFGAFCDVGCGIAALLPIDCLSVSRIASPADRVRPGQQLRCAVRAIDRQGRLVLTLRELLGTWQQNADLFAPGETVMGIVRSVEEYGVFVELAPNLAGLAEPGSRLLSPGQVVSVSIKNIMPDKMKIKLVILSALQESYFIPLRYFITEGRLDHWVYSTPGARRLIETRFDQPPANCPL